MTEWCRVACAKLSFRPLGLWIRILLPLFIVELLLLPQKPGDIVEVHFTTALLSWKKLLCSGNRSPVRVVIRPYMWMRRG